jgi:hypothetical protein
VGALACGLGAAGQDRAVPAAASPVSSSNPLAAAPPTENWTSLSLKDQTFQAHPPVFGEKDDFPTFSRELWQVEWRDGDPLDLYIIRPKQAKKPRVILYLYGFPTDTNTFKDDMWCKVATLGGNVAAVGFVSALTGHRFHDRGMKEWFVSELQEALVTSVHDVQMVMNYLATRNDLDLDQLGMFGDGSGASIAIMAAAVDPRIKVLDLMDPWGDWPNWLAGSPMIPEEERATYLKPAFLKSVAPFDPLDWLPKLTSQTIRLQDAIYVPDTPQVCKQRLDAALPASAVLVKYKSAREVGDAAADGKFFDWIKQQVGKP